MTTTLSNDLRKQKMAIAPIAGLRYKVLWLHNQRQKQKALASPPPIFYNGRHLPISLNNTFIT